MIEGARTNWSLATAICSHPSGGQCARKYSYNVGSIRNAYNSLTRLETYSVIDVHTADVCGLDG